MSVPLRSSFDSNSGSRHLLRFKLRLIALTSASRRLIADHGRAYRGIRSRVDQNETSGRAISVVCAKKQCATRFEFHFSDTIHFQLVTRLFSKSIYVHAEPNLSGLDLHLPSQML